MIDIFLLYYCNGVISSGCDVTTSHSEAETTGKIYRRSWPHGHGKKDAEHDSNNEMDNYSDETVKASNEKGAIW